MPVILATFATTVVTITLTFSGIGTAPTYSISGGSATIEKDGEIHLEKQRKNVKLQYNIVNKNGANKAFLNKPSETLFINQDQISPLTSYAPGAQFTFAEVNSDRSTLIICYNNDKNHADANGYTLFLSGNAKIDPAIRNGGDPQGIADFGQPTGSDCKRLPLAGR